MSTLLIKNTKIVSPIKEEIIKGDILIENGRIKKIAEKITIKTEKIIDAKGNHAFPGFVDIHVHFRDPGFTHKEDIITGSKSAAAGGFTSVVCMANTFPVVDNPETLEYIIQKAQNAKIKIYPVSAVSYGLNSDKLTNFEQLKNSGAIAISNDGLPIKNDDTMKTALVKAKELNLPLLSHAEDMKISKDGIMNEGIISKKLNVPGISRESEDKATQRDINLAKETDCPVHIQHVSTAGSVDIIRLAKKEGVKITAETAPHYFSLTEECLLKKDANFRMNPPLRTKKDVKAIIEGIKDGTIDCIATDHAPHAQDEKADFFTAPNGIVGLETSFAVAITKLYKKENISLSKIAQLMSFTPAKILNFEANLMREGDIADISIAEIEKKWTVETDLFLSKGKNSPYKDCELKGKIYTTICEGEIVHTVD